MPTKQRADLAPKLTDSPEESAFVNDIEFDAAFRGYDRAQVDDYIEKLTVDYNAICKKCAALDDENRWLRRALAELMKKGGPGA